MKSFSTVRDTQRGSQSYMEKRRGKSAGSHHGRSHPWQTSCGEDPTGKGGSGFEGLLRPAWASISKPESVCLTILCLSPTLLTLTGVYPWPPFPGENQLRALANKSLGHERNISIQTPSVSILACLAGLSRLLQLCMWLFTPPNCERHRKPKTFSKNIQLFKELKAIKVVLV